MSFIAIEGLDASGKSTQINLLLNYLESHGYMYNFLHFPRTQAPIFGELVGKFLRGDLGSISEVNPYLVALIFAMDRNDAKELINKWIENKRVIIVDRYVLSNIAFQCAKIDNTKERNELRDWIYRLEYEYNRIPVPTLNLILDVPFRFVIETLNKERKGEDREYLNGNEDIHEKDIEFQKCVQTMYLEESDKSEHCLRINCKEDEYTISSQEKIHNSIISTLINNKII